MNLVHKNPRVKIIKQETDKKKREQLKTDIAHLKSDLINDTIEQSDPMYHQWIKDERENLFPKNLIINVAYDLACQPLQYLIHAMYINRKIEGLGGRPYQVFPQRNSYKPIH